MTTAAAATTAATATSAVQTNGSSQSHAKQYCESCKKNILQRNYSRHCSNR